MSSRFLCADLNNIFYTYGGVQRPCYRSIVSNTDTFEMIYTTGATLEAAASLLKDAGATCVEGLVLASN